MRSLMLSLLLILSAVSCGPAPDMPTYGKNKVELLSSNEETTFYLLPLKGEVNDQAKLWSGDYWALNQGNINVRWNSDNQEGFDYLSPTREEALTYTTEQLSTLSPTEKWDLLLGRYDYPLKAEVYTHAKRDAADWEGICNGWSPAAINHNEPTPKTLPNPDGIQIPFGSSDIKALLSYYYAFIFQVQSTQQIGRRCPSGNRWFNWDEDCQNDLNAGSFHVVLTNKVGLNNQSFLADIARFKKVSNHPVVGYEARILNENEDDDEKIRGTTKVIKVRTIVEYVDEQAVNTWQPVLKTPYQQSLAREYTYNLYLNIKNQIIGGKWKSTERPDFLWTMEGAKTFSGLLTGLEVLLN